MASWLNAAALSIIFGVIGNIVSFLVFLAPIPTFYTIYKKKTSDGFQSIPYIVGFSSAMLLLYYGFLKTNAVLIISINAVGCVIELAYLALFAFYASKREKILILRLLLIIDVGCYGLILSLTAFLLEGKQRINAVGWICAAFNIAVFAAPLSIMTKVVRSRSVKFMPFGLSFFLTLCATTWFFYGLLIKDMFIAVPNVIGFLLGIAQMILYMLYRNPKTQKDEAKEKQTNVTRHPCPTDTESTERTIRVEKSDAPNVSAQPVGVEKLDAPNIEIV
ncbi:hypothetical protein MLD38_023646 [Melastoma candidum]|uniref:Uncharacterized protein n=1 Tax=Melastoma candidum TaxID=119954 RepID=A0ACB9NQ14_9MYRT|nr:hypothetical protein MLD38_023646 [Melastoma candidum]